MSRLDELLRGESITEIPPRYRVVTDTDQKNCSTCFFFSGKRCRKFGIGTNEDMTCDKWSDVTDRSVIT